MTTTACMYVALAFFVFFFILSLALSCQLQDALRQLRIAKEFNTTHEKEFADLNRKYNELDQKKQVVDEELVAIKSENSVWRDDELEHQKKIIAIIIDLMDEFGIYLADINSEIEKRADKCLHKDESDES